MTLVLEDKKGKRARVPCDDAPAEYFLDQAPAFVFATACERELSILAAPGRRRRRGQKRARRRRFVRVSELATNLWLYREAS